MTGSGAHQPEPVGARAVWRDAESSSAQSCRYASKRPTAPFRLARRQPTRALALANCSPGRRRRARDRNIGNRLLAPRPPRRLAACAVAATSRGRTGAAKLKVSGSFLAIVVAMVLLGGAARRAGRRRHDRRRLDQVARGAALPAGQPGRTRRSRWPAACSSPPSPTASTCTRATPASRSSCSRRSSWRWPSTSCWRRSTRATWTGRPSTQTARRALVPLLTSDLVAALMAVGVSEITLNWGAGGAGHVRRAAPCLPAPARRAAPLARSAPRSSRRAPSSSPRSRSEC